MKHTFHKLLCLLLVLTLTIGLLPVGMFAGAADAKVVLEDGQFLVDDDFATAANKDTVTATVAGVKYQAVMGESAFATITEAMSKATAGAEIYVAAGLYEGDFDVNFNVSIYGNGMNINPNDEDWGLNSKRGDPANESTFVGTLKVAKGGLTKFVFNGFSITGLSVIREATSSNTFKGIDISYNYFHDVEQISSTTHCLYFTGTTVRSGRIAYNRIESNQSAKPLTFRNADDFVIQGNYIGCTAATVGFWVSAEMADKNTTPGMMNITCEDNYYNCPNGQGSYFNLSYASEVDMVFRNNISYCKQGLAILGTTSATTQKKIAIENNIFSGTQYDINLDSSLPCDASLISIRNNQFLKGLYNLTWTSTTPLDLSYNYFKGANTFPSATPAPIVYPTYTDTSMTNVKGEMLLDSVQLTGKKSNGDTSEITGIVVDNDARSIVLKGEADSVYETISLKATPKTNDVNVEYYSDAACTKKLTDGNVIDYLKKGNNLVYIKLITSLDNYSYKVYTLTIPRAASHETSVIGVEDYTGSVDGNSIQLNVPATEVNPNIQLMVSSGATYKLYSDDALTNELGGTVINNLPAGTSTYFVKVTAEDGETTAKYSLAITRPPFAEANILEFKAPDFVAYDEFEEAYIGTYSSSVESVNVDITVSDRATWGLYKDAGCTVAVATENIALAEGDNVYYIKVASEKEAVVNVYRLILRKETPDSEKQIHAVTSSAVSSKVTADTITVKIDSAVTEYTPVFDYVGNYWKMYTSYDDGVLSGVVSNNKLVDIVGGKHTYYIEVTAKDGTTKVYTFIIEREASAAALLTAIGGGNDFYVDRFDFVATTTVQNEGNFSPVFTVSDGATVVVMRGDSVVDLPIKLRPGVSSYTIVVTAENGTNKNEYDWTITCIGDGVAELQEGVVFSTAWTEYSAGDVVYASINGTVYKAYYGENAFSTYLTAQGGASSNGGIIYVMPGTVITSNISVGSVKLYGPNFAIDANTGNRYPEAIVSGKITASGSPVISGFTFTETGYIISNATDGAEFSNNIFVDEEERTTTALQMNKTDEYSNVVISGNKFDLNSEKTAISINTIGQNNLISNNYFANKNTGSMVTAKTFAAGSTLEVAENKLMSNVALCLDDDVKREGYLYVHDNTVTGDRILTMNASKATSSFALNINNNKVDTDSIAVSVTEAPAYFGRSFVANENAFADINLTFGIIYKTTVSDVQAADVTCNYFGTAVPGNNAFDNAFEYKPYYVDSAKTQLSNQINTLNVVVNDKEIVDNGFGKYAVVSDEADVKIDFFKVTGLPADAYGTIFIDGVVGNTASILVPFDSVTVTVTTVSHDESVREDLEFVLYAQTASPVYAVYNVVNSRVNGMNAMVVVDNRATTWAPKVAVIDNLPIVMYKDEACTKKIDGDITLTDDSTTVYGKVEGYEPVIFTIYKKLSAEKAIVSLKDAYTFEYTGSNTAVVQVDDRLTTADLSAEVSEGASYYVYSDAACINQIDETSVDSNCTLYYLVIAADETSKVFEVEVDFIEVTDPVILSIDGTKIDVNEDLYIEATLKSYKAKEGFEIVPVVAAGCTYKLYVDQTHELVYKNDTTFFDSNYVYVYATVTSPDKVVTYDYTIKLIKPSKAPSYVDSIPGWAKDAVKYTENLGIVNGVKTNKGVELNGNGATTREMMACFIIRMLGVDSSQYSYVDLSIFADADAVSTWAAPCVKAAVALGIFTGAKNGDALYLNPKDNITREQFAIVFVRAIGEEDNNVKNYALNYKDAAKISDWARSYVKIITKLGYMKGSDGNFAPKDSITRLEILQTIYNYMK